MKTRHAALKVALVLAVCALLPTAGASAQPLETAAVQLQLNSALAKKLKKEGVRLAALKPAHLKGRNVTLPATESSLEPGGGSGYLYLGGGLKWQAGKRVATVRRLLLNVEKHVLLAVVNGSTIKLADLAPQQFTLSGFDFTDAVSSLKLTGRGAALLNRRLGLSRVFKAGRSLGAATATGRFSALRLTGGDVALTVDNAFREKLRSVEADVRFPLPMTVQGGELTSALSGFVFAESGPQIFQHDTSAFGETFDRSISFITTAVSLETHKVSGGANVGYEPPRLPYSGPLATIPDSPIGFNPETGEASATFPMALDAAMASLLNETVGAKKDKPTLFSAGEALGTLSFTARTR
jgi:hypothetical protein